MGLGDCPGEPHGGISVPPGVDGVPGVGLLFDAGDTELLVAEPSDVWLFSWSKLAAVSSGLSAIVLASAASLYHLECLDQRKIELQFKFKYSQQGFCSLQDISHWLIFFCGNMACKKLGSSGQFNIELY